MCKGVLVELRPLARYHLPGLQSALDILRLPEPQAVVTEVMVRYTAAKVAVMATTAMLNDGKPSPVTLRFLFETSSRSIVRTFMMSLKSASDSQFNHDITPIAIFMPVMLSEYIIGSKYVDLPKIACTRTRSCHAWSRTRTPARPATEGS
jgi:hypothetical protein